MRTARCSFWNVDQGKKFEVVPAVEGTGLADVIPSRGAAVGDLFNNGKIDVVINCIDHTPVLLRNVSPDNNRTRSFNWWAARGVHAMRAGFTVYLTAGGIRQRDDVMSGGSY